MASKLKAIDLTGAIVGTSGSMDFNSFSKFNPSNIQEKAHLRLLNESGCGVDVVFNSSGNVHTLPAGGWGTFDLEPNDGNIKATVIYVLPNPPVSMLIGVYYAPGETVPATFTLGNSPIGIGGSISTVGQTLSNEGSAAPTEVIDIGTTTHAKLIDIFNDHFLWNVEQATILHQVLKGQASGNPLLIGQAGDNTEVLGPLILDNGANFGLLRDNVNGNVVLDATAGTGALKISKAGQVAEILGQMLHDQVVTLLNNIALQAQDSGAVARLILKLNASNQLIHGSGAANAAHIFQDSAGTKLLSVDNTNMSLPAKVINDGAGLLLVDWNSSPGVIMQGNPANSGSFRYRAAGGAADWSLSAISKFSGTGNVTGATHGLKINGAAVLPDIIIPVQNVAGSQTFGYNTLTTTTVNIQTGAGFAWVALAIKL